VKRARELIYTTERQASRDVTLAGLRPEPGSSQFPPTNTLLRTTSRVKQRSGCLVSVVELILFDVWEE
jgi:hypothetical protein